MDIPSILIHRQSWEETAITDAISKAGLDINEVLRFSFAGDQNIDFSVDPSAVTPSIRGLEIDWFGKYSENKFITSQLLTRLGLPCPQQMLIRGSQFYQLSDNENSEELYRKIHTKIRERIQKEFQNGHIENSMVMKPTKGYQGRGISFFNFDQIEELVDSMLVDNSVVVEERINSYPIEINNRKKDWNLRTFVTYNFEKEEYTCFAIVPRIDNDNGPVNLSISAKAITIDEILSYIDVSDEEKLKLLRSVMDISEKATRAIVDIAERYQHRSGNHQHQGKQLLAGVDIIIDKNLDPYIMEVNWSNSGGLESLSRIAGVDPIIPLCQSIVTQAKLNLSDTTIPPLQISIGFDFKFLEEEEDIYNWSLKKGARQKKVKHTLEKLRKKQIWNKFQDVISDHQLSEKWV